VAPSPQSHDAVVLTLSATGLAVARSLQPRGVRVYGVDSLGIEVGNYSRRVVRDPRIARLPPGPALLHGLLSLASEKRRKPVLYVAGDRYLEFVADNHQALRERFILQDSMRPEVSALLMDKRGFYQQASELGVAMPRTFFPETEPEAKQAADELRYPAIVKPTHGHQFRQRLGGNKLVEVEDAGALVGWWRRLDDWGGRSVLQEVIPGPESNIFVAGLYIDAAQHVRSLFTARKTRQYPPMYGSGSYMEACWSEDIARLSVDLVQRLPYTGICGTEYKWDPRDEEWKLIELNPRPTLWYALPPAAGIDIVWDAHCDLVGRPNPEHIGCQEDDVRWQLLTRDVLSAAHFLKKGELSWLSLLRTAIDPRRKRYAVQDVGDPGTIIGSAVEAVSKYRSHLRPEGSDSRSTTRPARGS
jgi:predicted ATP-grasp superfamily ATP-dependent carboligase